MESNRMEKQYNLYAKLAAILILIVGSYLVLRPFLTASLFAAVICVTTWPLYQRMLRKMKNRHNTAALVMTSTLSLLFILPLSLVAYNLADSVTNYYNEILLAIEQGPIEPPAWLKNVPIVGESVDNYWRLLSTSQKDIDALMNRLLVPAKNFLLAAGILLGQGVMEMSLAAFVSFFLYRDGAALVRFLNLTLDRVVGVHAENILGIVNNTIHSIMYSLLGTALAQGVVATIGFAIAGVPAALLLGTATAAVSLIPIGPPLVWGAASAWLFYHGDTGWGIFMLIWGFFLISSVDNVVKPLLISRGSNLPFILILFGVMGGLTVFGFVGVFIGPTLLAIGYSLLKEWAAHIKES
ncbi:MAG TPA: AI-2E family transporter [Gallionellaceae bacterium]|nr:AI-2E family transporter [Gallionellaceae bacterium]HQS74805.1 AI-2E family transporter [Gallionellaceae bacterium]